MEDMRENKNPGGAYRPPEPGDPGPNWLPGNHRMPGDSREASLMWDLILRDLLASLPLED